ncbi:ABC transporter permease [Actinoplanes sp. NPDC026670]|jgi:ABC-2 type transport system permease protein|uniref:ABC transporter permease n=1 Tax=Actinoplanes sp. NPDC026670 TaxID=3154700 RepID=UPI00340B8B64
MNLVRAELLKLRTTSLWWIFAITLVPLYGLALGYNWLTATVITEMNVPDEGAFGFISLENIVSNLYTSGQFAGVLLVLLLSAILVTNEFFHLTATATFLTTPRRELVILAKMAVAMLIAVTVWVFTTALNLIFAPVALASMNQETYLDDSFVWSAISLNLLVHVLWALVGIGCGVLIRSQIGTTITLTVLYVVGTQIFTAVFAVLASQVDEVFMKLRVLVPTLASDLLVSGPQGPDDLPRWVGAVVLLSYAVVAGVLGTLITKRRDIA